MSYYHNCSQEFAFLKQMKMKFHRLFKFRRRYNPRTSRSLDEFLKCNVKNTLYKNSFKSLFA